MVKYTALKPEEEWCKGVEDERWTIKYADGAKYTDLNNEFEIMWRNFLSLLLNFHLLPEPRNNLIKKSNHIKISTFSLNQETN